MMPVGNLATYKERCAEFLTILCNDEGITAANILAPECILNQGAGFSPHICEAFITVRKMDIDLISD